VASSILSQSLIGSADMYISTLRGVIKAMGGDLEIVARFPDGSVRINQFEELDKAMTA